MEWSMSGCHYPSPTPPEQDRRYQHKVSLVVRYFMIPCNICLILLATSTLGFAVLLFLNNCTLVQKKLTTLTLNLDVWFAPAPSVGADLETAGKILICAAHSP